MKFLIKPIVLKKVFNSCTLDCSIRCGKRCGLEC